MSAPIYGLEALRRLREQQAAARQPAPQPSLLDQIPPDAPMEDATITAWDGERFVAWEKWLAQAPVMREEEPTTEASPTRPSPAKGQARKSNPQEGLW